VLFAVQANNTHTPTHKTGWNMPPYTGNAHINKHSGTRLVILARHWLRLPDDGSCV